jgi:L-fuconolactonase
MIPFPIVDTHVHLWDINHIDYPWLSDLPSLNKSHLLEDYDTACADVNVAKMVFLQAEADPAQYRKETEWVTQLAAGDSRLQGIVSFAPLDKGDGARAELEILAQNPLVKGVRRIIQFEENIDFCLRPDFVKGIQALPEMGMHFEICINHLQMANTIKMVSQCPEVQFNLNHIGKPDIKNQVLDPWRNELRTLASFENVTCKISGLATEADNENWKGEDLLPYIDHVLACFGFDRTFYGGDWPVASLATEYPRWANTLASAVSGCSADELHKLFVGNATAFYRLS